MPSATTRAILTDIVELGLDPNQAHSVVARNGHLKVVLPSVDEIAIESVDVPKQAEPEKEEKSAENDTDLQKSSSQEETTENKKEEKTDVAVEKKSASKPEPKVEVKKPVEAKKQKETAATKKADVEPEKPSS